LLSIRSIRLGGIRNRPNNHWNLLPGNKASATLAVDVPDPDFTFQPPQLCRHSLTATRDRLLGILETPDQHNLPTVGMMDKTQL
jgi:hypothetical protein